MSGVCQIFKMSRNCYGFLTIFCKNLGKSAVSYVHHQVHTRIFASSGAYQDFFGQILPIFWKSSGKIVKYMVKNWQNSSSQKIGRTVVYPYPTVVYPNFIYQSFVSWSKKFFVKLSLFSHIFFCKTDDLGQNLDFCPHHILPTLNYAKYFKFQRKLSAKCIWFYSYC